MLAAGLLGMVSFLRSQSMGLAGTRKLLRTAALRGSFRARCTAGMTARRGRGGERKYRTYGRRRRLSKMGLIVQNLYNAKY